MGKSILVAFLALHFLGRGAAAAEKLTFAHVAINPGQGLLWVARDAGLFAKYGFSADVVLIPGTPRTVQALIAGDLDYIVAGTAAIVRAREKGADVVMLASPSSYSSQRVFVRRDSSLRSLAEIKGKIVGVTQYGSAGDTFLRRALKKVGLRETDASILQMGGTPGVAQALEAGKIEVGVLGDSGMLLVFRGLARPLEGASARELGFKGLDGPLTTTERKIRTDRAAVLRVVQAYVEAIHYFRTNREGTVGILKKYMRGLEDEHLGAWVDDVAAGLKPLPYPDEEALRAELEQVGAKGRPPGYFVDTSFLDGIKKSGFVEKLSR
ncbi:MAG TPA: ABC transporter substrate-binding protein [candidate division Zixibacteria bacterium]|nr:ABC transporter substrate-binding protein [candidate division Zixibacteria bacterium]